MCAVQDGGWCAQDGDLIVAQLMITYEWSDWRNAQCWCVLRIKPLCAPYCDALRLRRNQSVWMNRWARAACMNEDVLALPAGMFCCSPAGRGHVSISSSQQTGSCLRAYRWVQSVYVHPEHRKKGLYRRLYQHVRQLAKDSGASGIRLYADNDNARANQTVR